MTRTDELIKNAELIEIISGEGGQGTIEEYKGKRTTRAIKMRLTKEKCNGDRWAYIRIDGIELHFD